MADPLRSNRAHWDELVAIHFPFLERGTDGWRRLPAGYPAIPLTFSIRARR